MKKIITLLAAAGMVVAASAPASAVDVKMDYRQRISFQAGQEKFDGQNLEQFKNRVRLGLTMAASENLKGYVQFQLLNSKQFGEISTTHGDNDATVRQMYIDWTVPATPVKVRMGRMELGLPVDAFGENAVMAAGYGSRDGVVVTAPVNDWLGLSALWTRANYAAWTEGTSGTDTYKSVHDLDRNKSDDIFAAVANLKFNGVSGSVYAAYATIDGYALKDAKTTKEVSTSGSTLPNFEGNAYWIGFTSTFSYFDPFTLKLSAAFGEATPDDTGANDGMKGWNVQAKASYKTAYGTPVLGAWYFSGDDKGDSKLAGVMPSVQGAFTPMKWYNDGSVGLNGGSGYENPQGNWGIQAGIEKVSFIEGLSHTFLISYVTGTNDKANKDNVAADYLTTEDSFVSFDLINTYQIYKNLAAHLQLNYTVNDYEYDTKCSEDDYGFELTFEYKF